MGVSGGFGQQIGRLTGTAHTPKCRPPPPSLDLSSGLSSTLSSAHELTESAAGIPSLHSLPDLSKSHRDKQGAQHFPQKRNETHSPHPLPAAAADSRRPQGQEKETENDFRQQHYYSNSSSNSSSNSNSNNINHSINYNSSSSPGVGTSSLSPSSPGMSHTDTIFKKLQEKKHKHRKNFQSLIKSEMNVSDS